MSRPGKSEYYIAIAKAVSDRSTCLRRKFGAVIVKNDQIISTGYNGAPRKTANCIDLGYCARKRLSIPPGQNYELCRAVHAEMNAVIHASRLEMVGADLYLAGFEVETGQPVAHPEPCMLCRRVIINAGIARVIILRSPEGFQYIDVDEWIQQERELTP
jgi:dCMP deaminase